VNASASRQIERRLKNHLLAAQPSKVELFRFRIRQADAGTKHVELDVFLPSPSILLERTELMWPEGEVPVGPVYGQLKAETLLINRNDLHIWLPASPLSGHDYFLQDYVSFETSLILKEAFQAGDSWVMFHALEAWLSPVRFSDGIPIPSWLNREAPNLYKTLMLISDIRQLAGMAYEPDLRAYYGGIFLEALALLNSAYQPTNVRTSPLPEAVYDWTAVTLSLITRRLTNWEECEQEEAPPKPSNRAGEIELDEVNQRAWLPDRQEWVHLSQAIFLLLKLLDSYKYGVATYKVLEEELGHNRRNIHHQIARLRSILEPAEGDEKPGNDSLYIRVKWGMGYIYRPDGFPPE
jgi:hypothetical protein